MGIIADPSLALEEMQAYFLDVGQAEATLLRGPGFTILIDSGDLGKSDVITHLTELGVESLDLFILTHPHSDHIGQASNILQKLPVLEVWMSGYEHTTRVFEDVLNAILASEADYYEPRRGDVISFGDLVLEVLNPKEIANDLHDTNIVVRATYGEISFLFTGDAEKKTEDKILTSGLPVQAQVLQLGHHGSRTSSSLNFLLAVRPEVAMYSAELAGVYGHPHAEVVDRLKILEIPMYGTDRHGTILITTDGRSYQIHGIQANVSNSHQHSVMVDLNEASWLELQQIVHIGPERATAIINWRAQYLFRSLDDLRSIPGLSEKRIEDIKNQGLASVKE